MGNSFFKSINLLKLLIVLSIFSFFGYGCGGGGGDGGAVPTIGGGPTQIATWYKDADGDGYSDGTTQKSEARPSNIYYLSSELTSTSGDCNDNDFSIHPGASEVCGDSTDNNCDGKTDEDCCTTAYYVSPIGDDSNMCLSPGTPCKTIQHAIDIAYGTGACPVAIHVAAGTYKEHLIMDSWKSLEGGWYGDFSQRWDFENAGLEPDPVFATIIDGEDDGTCMKFENIEGVTVDGFIVQNGRGDIDQSEYSSIGYGGGAYCHNSSVNFNHTIFLENVAEVGMGLYSLNSLVAISKCVFRNNYYFNLGGDISGAEGGVIYHVGGTLKLSSSDFIDNDGLYAKAGIWNLSNWSEFVGCRFIRNMGGEADSPALYNLNNSPSINNCFFEANYCYNGNGGAIKNVNSNAQIINCLFVKNINEIGGGAITNINSSPDIINCTFVDNLGYLPTDQTIRGSINNMQNSSPTITNSIMWWYNNYSWVFQPHPSLIINDNSSTVTVNFSNIDQEGYAGQNGNIRQDPMFYDTDWHDNGTPDNQYDDEGGDYHLQQQSPCINAGDNAALPPDITDLDNDGNTIEPIPLDLDGNARIIDGIVNMGAYE